MITITRDTNLLISEIMDFIFTRYGESGELKLGIWDETADHSFYANIADQQNGKILLGETSFDCDTIEEALTLLTEEIAREDE